jgi:hypothetical protein
MQVRPKPFQINVTNPFAGDKLDRESTAVLLSTLIQKAQTPLVLAIDSKWGTGKSTFLKMWTAKLKNDGFACLYFSAWDTDFTQDPLVSLIGEIDSQINWATIPVEYQSGAQKRWEEAKATLGTILRQAAPGLLKLGTGGLVDLEDLVEGLSSDNLGDLLAEFSKRKIEEYEAEKQSVKKFKSNLEALIKDHISVGKDKGKPLLFFVDELDRCRPTYALALLERMKHIFDIEGIVFVLAIDKRQIGHSLRAVYGAGLDADEYLRRFIDLEYRLPDPPGDKYAAHLFAQYDIFPLMKQSLHPRYLQHHNNSLTMFGWLVDVYNLSLRAQEQCIALLGVILMITQQNENIDPVGLIALLTIKTADVNQYADLVSGRLSAKSFLERLGESPKAPEFFNDHLGMYFEGWLLNSKKKSDMTAKGMLENYSQQASLDGRADYITKVAREPGFNEYMYDQIVKKIEISGRFVNKPRPDV